MIEIAHREVAPGTVVMTLTGKLMLGPEGDEIVSLVEQQLAAGSRKFIFDLSGVTVIDSTGIGRFISSFNKIMAAGGQMRMAGASGHVMQSFRVSLLDKVFSFIPPYSRRCNRLDFEIGRAAHRFSGGIVGASCHVMQSFRVSLLDKVFSFYPTLQQAL